MVYIIIAIVVIFLARNLIAAILRWVGNFLKTIFFSPRVNSVLTIVVTVCLLISDSSLLSEKLQPLFHVLWVLCIIDCIRDILVAESYYKCDIDPLYTTKSILSIFTLGMCRGFFLLIVGPAMHYSEKKALLEAVNSGGPVSPCRPGDSLRAQEHYYDQELEKLVQSGAVISNEDTLRREEAISQKRLDKLYPKKFSERIVESVTKDGKEAKARRSQAEAEIHDLHWSRTYLGKAAFARLAETVKEAMKDRGPLSPIDIAQLEEMTPFTRSGRFGYRWCEMFIVQALDPLVKKGEFEDNPNNDNDPLDNHTYWYKKSTKQMASHDLSGDPRFALDD